MPQKLLITGANGLLGQKLVELSTRLGEFDVIATARGENRLPPHASCTYHSLDISDQAQVSEVLGKLKPDYVIHTAAMTNVDQCETEREACWQLNVQAVAYLAEACEAHDIFLLHLSTDFIFDGSSGPYDEQAQPNPLSYYGESKWAAEQLLLKSTIRWAIARTVLVYGIVPNLSRSNIILWVKNSLEAGKTLQVVDDQWRTPTLAEDLAQGCYLIIKKQAQGIYNISGPDMLTPYQMALQTAAFFGLDATPIHQADSSTFTQPAKRPPRTGFIIDKARRVLGYKPHSFQEGIALLATQLQEKP